MDKQPTNFTKNVAIRHKLKKKSLYSGSNERSWQNFSLYKKKRQLFTIFEQILLKSKKKLKNEAAFIYGLKIIERFLSIFNPSRNKGSNYKNFSNFFYKHIRLLQNMIKLLGSNIKNLDNFMLLKDTTANQFDSMCNDITVLTPITQCIAIDNPNKSKYLRCSSKVKRGSFCLFHSNVKIKNVIFDSIFVNAKSNNKESEILNLFLKISSFFQIDLNIFNKNLNVYLFILYLKLYELEEQLQLLNWLFFRINLDVSPYKFYRGANLVSFLETVKQSGYDFWHKQTFSIMSTKVVTKKFKLKKKWRFWREFKRYFLYDKTHILIKFKWLHNYKKILNHQYLESYNVGLQSKICRIYKKKISKSRLFSYLLNFDYRIDILSMRIFKIKRLKLTWALLYFGYLTVNFKPVTRYYILKVNDIIFGFFLLINFNFIYKIRFKRRNSRQLYSFLERESKINTFICLTPPIRYSTIISNKERLISKKFIRYTYLTTY